MASVRIFALSLLLAAGFLAAEAKPTAAREEIYRRATNTLENVVLYKPMESTNQSLAQRLVPLLLQQVAATNSRSGLDTDAFGRLENRVSTNRFVLYTRETKTRLGGREHDQVTYLWFYSPDKSRRGQTPLPCQAVRITLNAQGRPVIWEVLADRQPVRNIYVAGALEHAALLEHQGRLPDRRFAVETSTAAQPGIVVSRILEDSPVVFGPIVYLEAGSRSVATLICRCMPSQATTIVDTRYYEMTPLPEDWERQIAKWPTARAIKRLLDEFNRVDLAACLRLPKEF